MVYGAGMMQFYAFFYQLLLTSINLYTA